MRAKRFNPLLPAACLCGMLFLSAASPAVPEGAAMPRVEIPANPRAKALKYPGLVVVIDPGHGTMDKDGRITGQGASGSLNASLAKGLGLKLRAGGSAELPEELITLDYGMRIMARLREAGVETYSIRSYEPGDERPWFKVDYKGHDQEANNKLRAQWAEKHKAVLFLRIHFDGSENKQDSGFSIWYNDQSIHDKDGALKKASYDCSESIRRRLASAVELKDLGLKRFERPIYGFKHASMPAVLLELGYLSNPDDTLYVSRPANADIYAEAISQGILDYFAESH
ncbi:N-acetylmuramoyl-L-alanine amidase [bacterium]|nr:N-acetylmuramoyl-L-alanine amidase [bacterium]